MRAAATMPEIRSSAAASPEKRLKKKSSSHALSVQNIGLHNEQLAAQDVQQVR
jgi:hypothetical protein